MRTENFRVVPWTIAFVVAAFLAIVPAFQAQDANSSETATQEENIREAVFRYMFEHNASGQKKNAGVYCLSLGEYDHEIDPSDDLMKRLEGNRPSVRKISECVVHPYESVADRRTGKQGLIFRVTSIHWNSLREVEVACGYYEGGDSASGNTYTVVQRNGKWEVKTDKMNWIA
jgi:hypothetical protein